MKKIHLGNCEIGTSFEVYAVKKHSKWGDFYNFINRIDPDHSSWFGCKKEDVITVRCTIIANDISVVALYKDPNYDENCIDYLMSYDLRHDNMIVMHNIKVFNCCFPYGADAICFAHHDTDEYKKGDRIGYLCRVKIEEI